MNQNSRTVLITGASSGIGLSTALLFLQKNWYVVCLGKEQKSFNLLKSKLQKNTKNIEFHSVDFSNPHAIEDFFKSKNFR